MNNSIGHMSMSKRLFWPMFKRSWDKAFTEKNIQSAFHKSGIWPTDGTNVIKTITRPVTTSLQKSTNLCTPRSTKSIRRFHAAYDKEPTIDKVKKLFATTLYLSAQVSVLQHENRGLFKTLEIQKKKGRHGVRLNLAGQSNKNIIDCYSPTQVVKAREYQEEKAAFKLAEEQAKYERKVKRAANTLRKKQEEEEKRKRKAERETKAARQQLAKDLAIANKTLREKPASTTPQVKRATPTAPNRRKVSTQPRVGACTTTPTVVQCFHKYRGIFSLTGDTTPVFLRMTIPSTNLN